MGQQSPVPGGRPRCYVASPLGFTEAGRWYLSKVYLPALAAVVDPIDPWSYDSATVADLSSQSLQPQEAAAIGARNVAAIRSAAMLTAYLDGQEVDAGTAAEIGFAAALDIPCFGLRSDLRQAGEPGLDVNLQVEAFIVQSGGSIVRSLDDLVQALAVASQGVVTG